MHRVRVTFIVAVLLSLCGGLFHEELILEDAKNVQVSHLDLVSVLGLFSCIHHSHLLLVLRVIDL